MSNLLHSRREFIICDGPTCDNLRAANQRSYGWFMLEVNRSGVMCVLDYCSKKCQEESGVEIGEYGISIDAVWNPPSVLTQWVPVPDDQIIHPNPAVYMPNKVLLESTEVTVTLENASQEILDMLFLRK